MNQRHGPKHSQATGPLDAPRLHPDLGHCAGRRDTAPAAGTGRTAVGRRAVLQAGVGTDWGKTNVVTVNAKRSQVLLNGIWRFVPAVAGEAVLPKEGWAYIKVPGTWDISSDTKATSSDFVALGNGPQWENFDGVKVASAWYERQVPVPAEWQGRVISLRFDRICTDAIVYVNNVNCGRVPWPWGSVEITHAVTPGKTADIRVLIAAIADSDMVGHFWQNAFMAVTYSPAKLATRGLTGSVYLESRTSETHVSDAFVLTSTRKRGCTGRGSRWSQASRPGAFCRGHAQRERRGGEELYGGCSSERQAGADYFRLLVLDEPAPVGCGSAQPLYSPADRDRGWCG